MSCGVYHVAVAVGAALTVVEPAIFEAMVASTTVGPEKAWVPS